ncbi:MarR family winged helix-turn-helix transcriptional regulator [Streptomyces sp. NPDC059861]|uniref:MarR family winged helix-turn-helix transcriptional regulator n=1 Tax=Streptomyces sp. NPDC059861 TaxID=3346974 RepID=UPI0036517E2E
MTAHRDSGEETEAVATVTGDSRDGYGNGYDFGMAVGVVFRAYAKATEAAVGDLPGGPRGYFVLTAAVQGEASSQRSLADRFGVDRTVMTYLLDDLERAGLVERRPDPSDRRSRHIVATEHGRERWAELSRRVSLVEQHILAPLPEESRAGFQSMLCALAGHLDAHGPAVDLCQVAADFDITGEGDRAPRRGRRRTTG